ncbi:MAG: ImmA/IrrE family metallo-endopeptidase [Deltaproteobacteria bacterium]|nr:ImmA/IrrE family metallo-endopeptidase [Deltaproteobacteria bacterium]MBN2845466.1 ImmA/IrrE family metallo-endopeptidase [Deltaproteobacteria bacterium]
MKPKKMAEALHQRIANARESAGFTITEAAQQLGFKNYQTLSSIEKGLRNISANELIEMARLYGRGLEYFFNPEVSPEPLPLWRKKEKSNVTKEQRQFLSFLEKYSNLENLLDLKRRWTEIRSSYDRDDFKNDGFAVADKLGQDIHKKLDLGSRPACNLLNVLENNLRFKIIHLPLQEDASAASIVDDNLGVGIVINSNDVPWRRNYDLAHELFHIVTWNIFSPGEIGDGTKKTKPEQYADIFASSLLLPENHLIDALKELATNHETKKVDIIELAKDFGVSTEAILWRLVNLNKLKKSLVLKILDDSSFRDLDRTLRRELHEEYRPSRLPARFISLACRCLVAGKISRGTFAEYLEINRADVDDYLAEMGFAEENYEKIAVA